MAVLKRLLKMFFPYKKYVAVSLGSAVLVMVMNLALPQLLRVVIDQVIIREEGGLLLYIALAFLAISLVKAVFSFLQKYLMELAAQKIIFTLRDRLYFHLQQLSFSYYSRNTTGQLMSRVTSDVETLRRFLDFGIIQFFQGILMVTGILAVMFYMDYRLALVSLVTVPFLGVTVYRFARQVKPAFTGIQQQVAALSSFLQENLSGIRLVQAYTREREEIARFQRENQGLFDRNIAAVRLWSFYFPLMNFISGAGTVLIFWLGGRAVMAGELQLGELVAFNSYLLMMIMPLRMLGWLVGLVQRAASSGERVFEILDQEPEIRGGAPAGQLGRAQGRVEFRGVSFAYDGKREVLNNISFVAEPGQVVALVGATGSGKSTLVELIPRFYEPSRGSILLDGQDIRSLSLQDLRRNIGLVFQDPVLFSASLGENIAYGRPGAPREEIQQAARQAQVHDFIESLPEGYDTVIGERGLRLSGGQKQRVAIARALLVDPPVLILDDFTANLDTRTEFLIRRALQDLKKGRTIFLIAQRLSSLKGADQILVLDQGEIIEQGTHRELLLAGGLYAETFRMQYYGIKPAQASGGMQKG